jgi:NAD(P)-dependent dehydrogenase (short-subunit alcohol dehydrogenase family)
MKHAMKHAAFALTALLAACTTPPAGTRVSDAAPGTVAYDRDVFQTLLGNHDLIRREFREVDGGIESVTESDNAEVAALIQDHVAAMKVRVEHSRAIRVWDPMFREIFANADKIRFEYENTPKGVKVREVSDDPYVARLIQAHAKVVSGFVARGGAESQLAHEPPAR